MTKRRASTPITASWNPRRSTSPDNVGRALTNDQGTDWLTFVQVQLSVDRYYDPSTDQFLSIDPDVAETGEPYAYTGDDPLNATDPLGLESEKQFLTYLSRHEKTVKYFKSEARMSKEAVTEFVAASGFAAHTDASSVFKVMADVAANSVAARTADIGQGSTAFGKRNIGTIATVGAIAGCITPGVDAGCAAYQAGALAARVYQRSEEGTPIASAANAIDALTTGATFGLVDAPTSAGVEGLSSGIATTLRLHAALPDIFGLYLDSAQSNG